MKTRNDLLLDNMRHKAHAAFIGSAGYFDDEPWKHNARVKRAFKGHMRELHVRWWDTSDKGDFESFCRAVPLICMFFDNSRKADGSVRRAVSFASNFCMSIREHASFGDVVALPQECVSLWGGVDVPDLVAWCAVMHVFGGDSYTCCNKFQDNKLAQDIIKISFLCFDVVRPVSYTDKDVENIL